MNVKAGQEVVVSITDGVTTITLNRPPLNVLNIAFMRELDTVLADPATTRDARVVALAAEGKAFCAGVDVADHTPERTEEMLKVFHGLIGRIRDLEVPTVALVHAVALGGGFELASSCDLIVASENAKFAVPEITLGVFPPVAMVDLPGLVGTRKAAELIFTGSAIRAKDAEQAGLVNAVFAKDEFEQKAREFLGRFAKLSRSSLVETKRAFRDACLHNDPKEALKVAEERYLKSLMSTADAKEGIAAFIDKREPLWSHR